LQVWYNPQHMEDDVNLNIAKDAIKNMAESMRPFLDQIEKTQQQIKIATAPATEALKILHSNMAPALKEISEYQKKIAETKESYLTSVEVTPSMFYYSEPTMRLHPTDRKLFEEIRDKKNKVKILEENNYHIIYDKKEKYLSLTVPGKILTHQFKGGEAKRVNLFERLLRAKTYVPTKDLKNELDCPTDEAVRKLAQGINTDTKKNLFLKSNIIEGKSGFGYRINPKITIHKK